MTDLDYSTYPSIAASGSSVHVVWSEQLAYENNAVYYKRSTDGGVDWQGTSELSNSTSKSEVYPSISVSGTNIHVIWTENDEIYYRQSSDNGASWNTIVRLTNDPLSSESPCISTSGQDIHVAWQNRRIDTYLGIDIEHWGIYYKRSTDGGSTWGEDILLTNTDIPVSAYKPSLTASGTVVHVVWEDNIDGNPEIYYKRSINRGESWEEDVRLTNNTADSFNPSVAVSDLVVHVVWEDYRDEEGSSIQNPNIYYKRNPTGNDPLPVELNSFSASLDGDKVILNWSTATEVNNYGFEVERLQNYKILKLQDWEKIGFAEGHGNSNSPKNYSFTDNNPGYGKIGYRLKQIDTDGKYEYSDIVEVNLKVPDKFELSQNYPNPFNPSTRISWQ